MSWMWLHHLVGGSATGVEEVAFYKMKSAAHVLRKGGRLEMIDVDESACNKMQQEVLDQRMAPTGLVAQRIRTILQDQPNVSGISMPDPSPSLPLVKFMELNFQTPVSLAQTTTTASGRKMLIYNHPNWFALI